MTLQSLNLARIIASGAIAAVVLGAAVSLAAPANAAPSTGCDPGSCTATFSYTGSTETFTVPPGVTALTFAVAGAQGGALAPGFGVFPGGQGAAVGGVLPVSPGQQLTILVGQAGATAGAATFGGGGATASNSWLGAGGGGSFLFATTGQPLVAAGGGGGAAPLDGPSGGVGAGAGDTGGSGSGYCCPAIPATGATSTAGGTGGTNEFATGNDGSGPATALVPGTGGSGGSAGDRYTGAGGGGGFYGGGGGGYSEGGGGGSGYADPSITSLSSTSGVQSGNGVISISWERQAPTVALSQSPSAGITAGDSVTLSASVSGPSGTPSGNVEFDIDGSAIADCSAQPVSDGTATCTTTALPAGTDTLQASYLGDTVYAAADSAAASYPVAYPPLSVTTTSLPSGTVDDAYSTMLSATGGLAPYSWTVISGNLPDGLTLATSGLLAGTPSVADSGASFTAQATDAQGTAYTATAPLLIMVDQASQTIEFASTVPANAKVGDSYAAAATGGESGIDVAFSVGSLTTNSACSVSGSAVSFDHTGTCVLDADQSGNADYTAAPTAQQQIAVGTAAQAITYSSATPTAAVVGASYSAVATGGRSGNTVTFTIDSLTTNSACSVIGSAVSFDHTGTCVLDADQSGNADYTAAPTAQQSFAVSTVATSLVLRSSATPSVFGQPIRAVATVSASSGTPGGSVQFAVDGTDLGSPAPVSGGTAQSPDLTGPSGESLAPGAHAITASFSPSDSTVYTGASNSTTQVVNQAATVTTLTVHATSISAAVSAVAPGLGIPTGTVTFSVAGESVGTAALLHGAATLPYTITAGTRRMVAVSYGGDVDRTGSSASTARSDPSITATVRSAHAKSRYGWYRTPVTVTFHCATHGAALTHPCPTATRRSANGAGQSVTRTIAATDGGVATVTVRGIKLDHTAPSVKVTGIRNGAFYGGRAPAARCIGRDRLSGVARCTLSSRTSGSLTSYTATATDKAGNTSTIHGSYHVLSTYLQGATYRDGAFTVHAGHTYTLIVTGRTSRPTYYDAAVYPRKPIKKDYAFHAAGHHRWVLGVTITQSLRSHHYWNLGIKIGHTMHTVKVRIA